MECYTHCQSCGMPLDHEQLPGTEKNGQRSTFYCIYCYKDGTFTQPNLTIEDMLDNVRERLQHAGAGETVIKKALHDLPFLCRWLTTPAARLHRLPVPAIIS